jgi:D-beta-D-heptose 7-phosphate kinase/D-beta-D-heptose 1-phosphate adenosyltransferase
VAVRDIYHRMFLVSRGKNPETKDSRAATSELVMHRLPRSPYKPLSLDTIFSDAKNVSVLVVGDLMLDQYVYGTIDRISPEAPVSVVNWRSEKSGLGGAANVAHNLAQLGCRVFLAGVTGVDASAEELLQIAKSMGIDTAGVVADANRPTTLKTRIIAHGQQVIRIDREVRAEIDDALAKSLLDYVWKCLPQVDGVILSDYAKGVLTPSLCASVIQAADSQHKRVLVDPKGHDFSKYEGAFLLTPNKKELAEATHMPVHTEADIRKAADALFRVVGCEAILVTRGEEGMSLFSANTDGVHIQTEIRDVFDVTGAGDTVISMLGRLLFAGVGLLPAAQLANMAAGLKIGKLGAAAVSADEIIAYLRQREESFRGKILDMAHLKQVVGLAHSHGRKVVLTNGCFDLLHVGQVQFLQRAKALGQMLIVAINDDRSVRKLKGNGRPLIGAADRAGIIAGLASVDHVIVFSEATPLNLIKELTPDVLVKGGNYKLEEVIGRKEVESYGGRVALIPAIDPESSSQTFVKELAARYIPEEKRSR